MRNPTSRYLPRMSKKRTSSRKRRILSLKDMIETFMGHQQHSRGAVSQMMSHPIILPLLLLLFISCSEACSSRHRGRNRPPPNHPFVTTTLRPSITFDMFECPPLIEQVFCLNNASCFSIKVGEALEYYCNCTEGFMGRRCERKYVDIDSELLSQLSIQETLSEYAGIAGAMAYFAFLAFAMCLWLYFRRRRNRVSSEVQDVDDVDGASYVRARPFGSRSTDLSMERLVKKASLVSSKNGSKRELP